MPTFATQNNQVYLDAFLTRYCFTLSLADLHIVEMDLKINFLVSR